MLLRSPKGRSQPTQVGKRRDGKIENPRGPNGAFAARRERGGEKRKRKEKKKKREQHKTSVRNKVRSDTFFSFFGGGKEQPNGRQRGSQVGIS